MAGDRADEPTAVAAAGEIGAQARAEVTARYPFAGSRINDSVSPSLSYRA